MSYHKRLHKAKHQPKSAFAASPRALRIGVVALVLIVLGISGFLISNSDEEFVPSVIGAPHIAFAQDSVDHGDVHYGKTVESVFKFRNEGDEQLIILGEPHVQVVEGCCPPRAIVSDSVIEPGEEATITLRYSMSEGMGGEHLFNVHVRTNDPDASETTLSAASNWIP